MKYCRSVFLVGFVFLLLPQCWFKNITFISIAMKDLIILGAGPAGLAASIYASRYKIDHLVIGNVFDGSVPKAHLIENWPGEKSIKGYDLIAKFYEHAKSFGAEIVQENVVEIKIKEKNNTQGSQSLQRSAGHYFIVKTNLDKMYKALCVLIAVGTKHRKLGILDEDKFIGKGLSYCAVCDGAFFKNKIVAVVGGSNSAAMASTLLSELGNKVYMILRGGELKCEPIMAERLRKNRHVEIIYNTNVTKIFGNRKVESVEIDKEYKGRNKIKLNGIFVAIGLAPYSCLVKKLGVKTNPGGFVVIDQNGSTNIEGVYAAGDVTNGSNGVRQIITSASEGVIAVTSIYKYLKDKKEN